MFAFLCGEYIFFAGCRFTMIFPRYYDSLFTQYNGIGDAFLNNTRKFLYLNQWWNLQINPCCAIVVPTLIQMYLTVLLHTVEELWKLEGFREQLNVNWTDCRSLETQHVLWITRQPRYHETVFNNFFFFVCTFSHNTLERFLSHFTLILYSCVYRIRWRVATLLPGFLRSRVVQTLWEFVRLYRNS